jgi:CMP-N,N'-diacetyllegionaminic acid synthase
MARGGSKGIPRKNLSTIGGRKLIEWSLLFAQEAPQIMDIIVSSDDDEILSVASNYQVSENLKRPECLAQDTTTDLETLSDILERSNILSEYDAFIQLRPTNPFRKLDWIDQCVELINKRRGEYTAIRTIESAIQNPYKMWLKDDNNKIEVFKQIDNMSHSHSAPRQILPHVYFQNAHLDIIKTSTIQSAEIVGEKPLGLVVPSGLPDIDTKNDLEMARKNFRHYLEPQLLKYII